MRIDTIRAGAIGSRGAAGRTSSGVPFHVNDGSQTQRATPMSQASATQDIGSLLALQSVEDPLLKKRKLVRRGQQLLDTLESLKADLLVGNVGEDRLKQLMTLIGEARERSEPGLDGLLDDIELRARVELAKRGLFPTA
ncbi:flagellar assembly protein FliX [Devosia sp.]|uniref:flagellar assembly protein FliX n=1 Tax=Devosia sp. TaxID=1871048 RepID=UPI0037BEBAB7